MPNVFCDFPFEHMDIKRGGNVYLCCAGRMPQIVGNVAKNTLQEIWNGPAVQKVWDEVRSGAFHSCSACHYLKEQFAHVRPRNLVEKFDSASPAPLRVLFSLDRTCNLSCPSCRKGLIVESIEPSVLRMQNKALDEAAAFVKEIWFSGDADPFASELSRDALFNRAAEPLFTNCVFGVQTNGLLFKRSWHKLPAGRLRKVTVSIDACDAATYENNRRGGRWIDLIANLLFMSQLRKQGDLTWFKLQFVVQQNNWRQMKDFVAFAEYLGADRVGFTRLTNWRTYTQLEYNWRAVHLSGHQEHQEFKAYLHDPVFRKPFVRQYVLPCT